MKYQEIEGDLIKLTKEGKFNVIAHGCNCFCVMGAGIAPQMAVAFGADKFPKEDMLHRKDFNKLGTIDYQYVRIKGGNDTIIVNAYTQYGFGANHEGGSKTPLDYDALRICMRKINHIFKGGHIGLPKIGCGLAGGNWRKVRRIIKSELKDCKVTVVIYKN